MARVVLPWSMQAGGLVPPPANWWANPKAAPTIPPAQPKRTQQQGVNMENKFKVGDKVNLVNTCGLTFGPHSAYPAGFKAPGVVERVIDEFIDVRDARDKFYGGLFAFRFEKRAASNHVEPANETPIATKHWFICVLDEDGDPAPAETPRLYKSAEQARAVATTMAEKNPGERFVVYEATDVVMFEPPVPAAPVKVHQVL